MRLRLRFLVPLSVLFPLMTGCGRPVAAPAIAAPRASTSSPKPATTSTLPSASAAPATSSAPVSSGIPVAAPAASAMPWVSVSLGSFGTVSLPPSWNPTPSVNSSQDGSLGYYWSAGADAFTFLYAAPFGANHNVTVQSSPFDPTLALPAGTVVAAHPTSNEWNFSGSGLTGAIFTTPSTQGAYIVWISGPNFNTLQSILESVRLYNSDFSNGLGG